jgi:hypothetical protein
MRQYHDCTSPLPRAIDGHADALEQCTWHCHDDQGNIGSLWTLPSGDYSLHIAPRATSHKDDNQQNNDEKNMHYIAGYFNGHRDVVVQYRVYCQVEEVQGFTRIHRMPPLGKYSL